MENYSVFRMFDDYLKREFRPETEINLNRKEGELLVLLTMEKDAPLFQYAHLLGIEKGSFVYVVDLLEYKQLIESVEDPMDRRKKNIILLPKGEQIANSIQKQFISHIQSQLSIFSAEELLIIDAAATLINRKIPKMPRPPFPPRPKED